MLAKLFLLAVWFFFEERLSFECSLCHSSRSATVLSPLRLDDADLSSFFSLLKKPTRKNKSHLNSTKRDLKKLAFRSSLLNFKIKATASKMYAIYCSHSVSAYL